MIIRVPGKKTQPDKPFTVAMPPEPEAPLLFLEPDGEPDLENGQRLLDWLLSRSMEETPDEQRKAAKLTAEAAPVFYDPETDGWDRLAVVDHMRAGFMKSILAGDDWPCEVHPPARMVPIMVRDMFAFMAYYRAYCKEAGSGIDVRLEALISQLGDAVDNYIADRLPED